MNDTTKTIQFIEKAIEGGWNKILKNMLEEKPDKYFIGEAGIYNIRDLFIPIEKILLDPKAWQAVGKTEGWDKPIPEEEQACNYCMTSDIPRPHDCEEYTDTYDKDVWKRKMRKMTNALCEGQSIKEYLLTLNL